MIVNPWRNMSGTPELARGDCQIWHAWLDEEDPASMRDFLSPDEVLRAGRLHSPLNANRFCIARGILRTLLGNYLAVSPAQVKFTYGPHGKPALADGSPGSISFNATHSNGLAVFAVANGKEIGVDVEKIRPIKEMEGCSSIFLSPEEYTEFKALPANEKLERFITLWISKEAILKSSGVGFSNHDQGIFTTFIEQPASVEGHNLILRHKQLTFFTPAEGFKGALACL
jgi:4'-phosphopantetheinyl transferase